MQPQRTPKVDQQMAQQGLQPVAQQSEPMTKQVPGGVRKWEKKVLRREWIRDGQRHQADSYSVRLAHGGRREWVNLLTADLREAARRAARFAAVLKVDGWEVAHHDLAPEQARIRVVRASPTVGEWLRGAELVFQGKPPTFALNASAFRRIVASIEGIEDPGRRRYDYVTGGRQKWREAVEGVRLASITPTRVEAWRGAYLKRATTPLELRQARRNSNSYIRQARGLFSKAILKRIDLTPPDPLPFAGIEFEDEGSYRYVAKFDAADLMAKAQADLRDIDPPAWVAFVLLLCAGLRRGEVDLLCWTHIDPRAGTVRVAVTDTFSPKSSTSERVVPLAPSIAAELEGFRSKATGLFVVESPFPPPPPGLKDRRYRCRRVFKRLLFWLRSNGANTGKPLHELRKEFGSIIASQADLFTASRLLGHANLDVTQRFYAENRTKAVVDLLPPAGAAGAK